MSPERPVETAQSDRQCGNISGLLGVEMACQLDHGHDGPHRHEDEHGVTTWEPRYAADLRRERDDLREAIRDIGSAWRGGDDAEIATAIGAATDLAGFSEQGGG